MWEIDIEWKSMINKLCLFGISKEKRRQLIIYNFNHLLCVSKIQALFSFIFFHISKMYFVIPAKLQLLKYLSDNLENFYLTSG